MHKVSIRLDKSPRTKQDPWVTSRQVMRILLFLGCVEVRQKGSHRRFDCPCGKHHTTVPVHAGEDIKRGTLHGIQSDLSCLGKGWLK